MSEARNIIIVGATSGIGLEMTKCYLQRGDCVWAAGRHTDQLQALQQQFGEQLQVWTMDVTAPDAPQCLEQMANAVGRLDLYLHVAGVGWQNPSLDVGHETVTAETNVLGFTALVDAAFHLLCSQGGGQLAVISSIAGTKGLGVAPAYSASKAYQTTYIQALEQLAVARHLPIAFTDIRPGFVRTPLLGDAHFPMCMPVEKVARLAVRAIDRRQHVAVLDHRYRLLTALWHCVPHALWRRMGRWLLPK